MLDYFFAKKDPLSRVVKWVLLGGHFINLISSIVIFVLIFTNPNIIFLLAGIDVDPKFFESQFGTKLLGKYL